VGLPLKIGPLGFPILLLVVQHGREIVCSTRDSLPHSADQSCLRWPYSLPVRRAAACLRCASQ
jgi:hypothetical protein